MALNYREQLPGDLLPFWMDQGEAMEKYAE